MKNIIFFFVLVFGLSTMAQVKKKGKPVKSERFSVEIQGKVLDNCLPMSDLSFGEFHGTDAEVERLKVNARGEFVARYWLSEPGLFFLRKGGSTQYFLATPKEKVYKIGLSCTGKTLDPLQVFYSSENKAYIDFIEARKKVNGDFEDYRGKDLNDTLIFKECKSKLLEYQSALTQLVKKHPNTYVAQRLVPAEKLNTKDFATIESLRQGYLKRTSFGDSKFYNTPLPSFILENYLNVIADKKNESFAPLEWVLAAAAKNKSAAERLQELLFEAIQKSKREDLMKGYINWARANEGKMVNEITKFKMDGLAKSMVDAQFINISLKDTVGNTKELRETVLASKYTLLVIYNPDCSHCIATIPKLIPIAGHYQSKGLGMFTVAANNSRTLWLDFIKQRTGPGWVNVMEDNTNSSFGKYSVTQLPSFVLIDSKGKIVARMVADNVISELQKWLSPL